jgi:hypothetical protein
MWLIIALTPLAPSTAPVEKGLVDLFLARNAQLQARRTSNPMAEKLRERYLSLHTCDSQNVKPSLKSSGTQSCQQQHSRRPALNLVYHTGMRVDPNRGSARGIH